MALRANNVIVHINQSSLNFISDIFAPSFQIKTIENSNIKIRLFTPDPVCGAVLTNFGQVLNSEIGCPLQDTTKNCALGPAN